MTDLGVETLNSSSSTTRRRALQLGALTAGGLILGATAAAGSVPVMKSATTSPVVQATISLQSMINNRFVCAESAGAKPLIANRTVVGEWEKFDLIGVGNGQVAMRAHANGRFVCAESAGTKPLIANRTSIGLWETFTLAGSRYGVDSSLFAAVNKRYVTAENAGALPLIANRTAYGPWEKFIVAAY